MKRYGRTVITSGGARTHAFEAKIVGADHADYSGSCASPVFVPLTGIRSPLASRLDEWHTGPMDYAPGHGHIGGGYSDPAIRHVDLAVRCRRCPQCLKARAYHWTERAAVECARSTRTWFGTLTLRPEVHFRCLAEAKLRLVSRCNDMNMESDEAFSEICRPVLAEYTRFLKRVRKHAPGLRHLCVVEKHKSGLPHLHFLLHETSSSVTHRQLTAAWTWGFSKFKLVPVNEQSSVARYACKYLAKSMLSRIRASLGYGSCPP